MILYSSTDVTGDVGVHNEADTNASNENSTLQGTCMFEMHVLWLILIIICR